MERLFGTDGIRGLVDEFPMSPDGAYKFGKAMAVTSPNKPGKLYFCDDGRASGPEFTQAAAEGAKSMGRDTAIVGTLTTPGLALHVQAAPDAVGGAVFSASHNLHSKDNPAERWNGFKPVDSNGDKISDQRQDLISALMQAPPAARLTPGRITHEDNAAVVDAYIAHQVSIVNGARIFEGLRLGVDTAHGAASGIAGKVLEILGAKEILAIGNTPNGWNINDGYGATALDNIRQLVVSEALDAALATDGDSDRGAVISSQGVEIDGDMQAYIQALTQQHKHIAVTHMTNGGIVRALEARGVRVVRTDVGDRYLLEAMRSDPRITLGAEKSNHVITRYAPTGDGITTFLLTMSGVINSGRSLDEWRHEIDAFRMPQILTSIKVRNKDAAIASPEVTLLLEEAKKKLGASGRLSLRKSGTGHEVRFMIEDDNPELVQEYTHLFRTAVRPFMLDTAA